VRFNFFEPNIGRLIGQLTEATRLLIEMAAEFRNENSVELREKRKHIMLDP